MKNALKTRYHTNSPPCLGDQEGSRGGIKVISSVYKKKQEFYTKLVILFYKYKKIRERLIQTSLRFIPAKILFKGGVLIQNLLIIRGIKLLERDSTEYSCRDIK